MSEKIEGSIYGWVDMAQIVEGAPPRFRPGEMVYVVGWMRVLTPEVAAEFGEPVGQPLLTVEYEDGSDAQVPERFLTLVEEGR